MPNWKSVQSKRKLKQKTKLAFLVLGSIILLIFLSQAVRFTKSLFNPWTASKLEKKYTWNGKFNINLIFKAKNISLISYNPTDSKLTIVDLPGETYLQTAHGYGSWQLRAIFDLGGEKLLKDTLMSFFGQPIDGFLDFGKSSKEKTAREMVDLVRKNPFSGVDILPDLKTDLTPLELLRLKWGIWGVRFDKVREINLVDLGVLQKDRLLDGSEVLIVNTTKLDLNLVDLADPNIKSEHKTIALLNATEKPLLAQNWARLISNMGGDVIITSNAKWRIDKTQVLGEKSQTLIRLSQIFGSECDKDCDKIGKDDEDMVSSRAQINIKLAQDLVN